MCLIVLRAIAIVQKRGIAAIRAESNRCGKAVQRAEATGRRRGQELARGKRDLMSCLGIFREKQAESGNRKQDCGEAGAALQAPPEKTKKSCNSGARKRKG